MERKLGVKFFKLRLAKEQQAIDMTGYEFNGITPFMMKTDIPVILSKRITELEPAYLWFGGGRADLKLGISV